jgi:hypothetical protein
MISYDNHTSNNQKHKTQETTEEAAKTTVSEPYLLTAEKNRSSVNLKSDVL